MVMKGFIKTVEAGIAIVLMLVSIVFLFVQNKPYEPQIADLGYNCLKNMDDDGTLRYYAENNLESNIISDLRYCIPPLFDYKVKVCTTSHCISELQTDKTIFLSSYIIAGSDSFNPRLVNLWIWST
ncbi:hypothetical protein A3K64_00335 [Candidatus Micrarchaeota archaeon RBG_16_36_9]|nr:MAG: hypothetical protein A3K64_00335 [Candidatus Micrarchaeota archaeon RBG_16_36_9]